MCLLYIAIISIYLIHNNFGYSLITDIYYGNRLPFLHSFITDIHNQPLNNYFEKTDEIVNRIIRVLLFLVALTIIYAASKKLTFYLNTKLYLLERYSQSTNTQFEITKSIPARLLVIFFCGTLFITIVPLFFAEYAPLLDYPWHIARIYILDNWDRLSLLQRTYDIGSFILPNIGMDIVALLLAKLMPIHSAGQFFIIFLFALTISGTIFLFRSINGYLSLWPLISSVFLFNWIFLLGFLNYLLGIGLLLWAIGIWINLKHSSAWFRLFIGALLTTSLFFCHIVALGLYAIFIAAYELQQACKQIGESEWLADRNLFVGAAIFLVPLFLFTISPTSNSTDYEMVYNEPWFFQKLLIFFYSLSSGNRNLDLVTITVLCFFIIITILHGKFLLNRLMIFPLLALLLTYLALPYYGLLTAAFIDTRIPIAIVFILIASCEFKFNSNFWNRIILFVAASLLVTRSLFLSYDWHKYDIITQEFIAAFNQLPSNSIMFVAEFQTPKTKVGFANDHSHAQNNLIGRDFFRFGLPTTHIASLATLHNETFVPSIWSHPKKQTITVNKNFKDIKNFQRNNPITVHTTEELAIILSKIRDLTFDVGIPIDSVFLLVIDVDNLEKDSLNKIKIIQSGSHFKLLSLST